MMLGEEESVLIREVSLFQVHKHDAWGGRGVLISGIEKYTNMVLGEEECVLFREVSVFRGCPYRGVHYIC